MTRDKACEWLATCGHVGHLPLAPGTWASLLACIIVYFVPFANNPVPIALLTVGAILAVERVRGTEEDPGWIVIDELVGMLIATIGQPLTVWNLTKSFILFRAFDILKPYPIRKLERLPGAYGIMADDVLAGVLASVVLFTWGRVLG